MEKILNAIKENSSVTVRELTVIVGLTRRGVEKQVALLKAKGILHRVGPDKGGHWEIDERERIVLSQLPLTQDNLYLLILGKVFAVAEMYARHHDVALIDAMRKVYASDMYKQLEIEKTKFWHLGPVALYQAMDGMKN